MNETSSQRQPHNASAAAGHAHGAHADHHRHHGHGASHGEPVVGADALKDPVCGMAVSAGSAFHTEHAGLP